MGRHRSVQSIMWYAFDSEPWENRRFPKVVDVFFWKPLHIIRKIIDGEWQDASEPLYPGYALAGSREGWRHIESAVGLYLLRTGKRPVRVPEEELEQIRSMEAREVNLEPEELICGQEVEVVPSAMSSFAGLRGRFLQFVPVFGGRQAQVVFDLYGERRTVAMVAADYLEVV